MHTFSFIFFLPLYFELMRVEHKQNLFKNTLEALGETACYCSVSTLDAAIIVFYMKKKLFALNSLLEEYGFTFWSV